MRRCGGHGVTTDHWLRTHVKLLGLFADPKDIDDIRRAGKNYGSVALQVKRLVESSSTGKVVYKTHWATPAREVFRLSIGQGLQHLDSNGYDQEAVREFFSNMVASAGELSKQGHKTYSRTPVV